MAEPNPIYIDKPFSKAHLRSLFGMSSPRKLAAMTALMPWDYFYRAYDFNESTLSADWTANVTGGGGPTAFAYNAQRNAALRGATGATSGDVTELVYGSVIFDAADSPFMWVRFVSPAAVTSFAFEIGFSDPHTAATQGMLTLTAAAVPTIHASITDIAAVAMDTSYTLTTAALIADGTTGAPTGVSITNDAGTAWTPTASALIDVMVGVRANTSYCWVWDSQARVGVMRSVAQGPDTGVLLAPYMLFRTRNTTSKTIDLLKCVLVAEENRTS